MEEFLCIFHGSYVMKDSRRFMCW